jgi:uncharacterized protein (TIGR02001 family)
MKKTPLVAAVALSAVFAGSAVMAEDFSYNLSVTSDYVWRGISKDNDLAALQGGVDYAHGLFYVGTWLSNVDLTGANGKPAKTEWDLYAGIAPTVGNWYFNFGAIYSTYPSFSGLSFGELQTDVSHTWGKGTIGINMFTPVQSLERPYVEIAASYPLTDKLSISGALGSCGGDANNQTTSHCNGVTSGYQTWNAGLTYQLTSIVSLDLRYSETSLNAREVNGSLAAPKVYATLKASF